MNRKVWGGRFAQGTTKSTEAFTASIGVDVRLLPYDIALSKAHAAMLREVSLLSHDESCALIEALTEIERDFESGKIALSDGLEDIHMHVENELISRLGDVGRKIHTGRSRNDQVVTAFRMWAKDAIRELSGGVSKLLRSFVAFAERERGVTIPGYTHLQRAQPIDAAHYALAHVERFARDLERLEDSQKRVDVSPLGSAALSGTSLPIDRARTAAALGFAAVSRNSLDATSDRDFVVELLANLSLIAVHLSGLAEEWIMWSTTEFSMLILPEGMCTGSSIMPQKRNPDVLELIRGKSGKITGALTAMLMTLKGLPAAYNRDLQEDKAAAFEAVDTVLACLRMAAEVVDGAAFDRAKVGKALNQGFLDATAVMEALILEGIPMRKAHHLVGALVRVAESTGSDLESVPLEDATRVHEAFRRPAVRAAMGVQNAVQRIISDGGTGPCSVSKQLKHWWRTLSASGVES